MCTHRVLSMNLHAIRNVFFSTFSSWFSVAFFLAGGDTKFDLITLLHEKGLFDNIERGITALSLFLMFFFL